MNPPRSGFAAPPQGGDPGGRAEPVRGVRWTTILWGTAAPFVAADN